MLDLNASTISRYALVEKTGDADEQRAKEYENMINTHLLERLEGIQRGLVGLHASGDGMSAASKGREREGFVDQFLRSCHPPVYRFGTGDITDSDNRRSGQIDIVVEYPFAPSLTLTDVARLYLAESVAAVVEVKSNLAGQWREVQQSAASVHAIKRNYTGGMANVGGINEAVIRGPIPYIAVGYTGWAQVETAQRHLTEAAIDGILVIDRGLFVSSVRPRCSPSGASPSAGGFQPTARGLSTHRRERRGDFVRQRDRGAVDRRVGGDLEIVVRVEA